MRSKLLMALPLLWTNLVLGQLTITRGAQFSVLLDARLTLQNTDLVNNGDMLLESVSPVSFTGNAPSFIGGDGTIRFFNLEINKTGNQSVSLQKSISIGNSVFFISGFLNLNGSDLDLETTARLDGESENSRVIGPNGGKVVFSTNLTSPLASNPANLGLLITSNQALGNVTIKRGHQSQAVNPGLGNSIFRYYDITPTNNTNLEATLQVKYLDGELNGIDESSLMLFKTDNGVNWSNQGFTTRNETVNFVEKTRISSFGRFTLSSTGDVLADGFRVWPNPFRDVVFINIVTGYGSTAFIKIFDSKGALVKMQKATVLQGSNQLSINIGSLANGIYTLYADCNNGQIQKSVPIIKQ